MNTISDHMILKIRDGGYSMRENGRKAGAYAANGDAINVISVESLKDGDERQKVAEKRFAWYLKCKAQQGYTFEDLEAAKAFYMQGFLGAYERVATKRRQLARKRGEL
jgi:hypothetical protein